MTCTTARVAILAGALSALLAGCQRNTEPQKTESAAAPATAAAPAPPPVAPAVLADVVDNGPGYIVGISYPPDAAKYPGLVPALTRFADESRAGLMEAVKARKASPGDSPYDLTLSYTMLAQTPEVVAVAADGSRFLGGAHSQPLIARFVWLPRQQQLLTAEALLADPAHWPAVAGLVRKQLMDAAEQRATADNVAPADRSAMLNNAKRMIDDGTARGAAQFANFEPVLDANGKISALRFVFPPYQVGPYSDGTQTVDVPAAVLLPFVAPKFRPLFAVGPG